MCLRYAARKPAGRNRQKTRISSHGLVSIEVPGLPNVVECRTRLQTRKDVIVKQGSARELRQKHDSIKGSDNQ